MVHPAVKISAAARTGEAFTLVAVSLIEVINIEASPTKLSGQVIEVPTINESVWYRVLAENLLDPEAFTVV